MYTLPLSRKALVFLFLFWSIGIFCVGFIVHKASPVSEETILGTTLRDPNNPYRFVDPLLACNVGATAPTASLDELKKEIVTLFEQSISSQKIEDASIYVRRMRDGSWTGVNTDTTYTPASLMKVPILITYLKQSEYNPDFLSYTVTITQDPAKNQEQDIAPEESVVVGETYTINELLSLMIVQSDNRALNVLMNYLDSTVLEESFTDLGITTPEDAATYTISPRLYSRFFRILYNATYLSEENSEKALRLLNKSAFLDGIRAGVPEDIDVAHKFGEASTTLDGGVTGHELHDCGIVYTDNPYVLCVMTKGKNVDELSTFLKDASRVVHEAM